jgi:hypothetical protein
MSPLHYAFHPTLNGKLKGPSHLMLGGMHSENGDMFCNNEVKKITMNYVKKMKFWYITICNTCKTTQQVYKRHQLGMLSTKKDS